MVRHLSSVVDVFSGQSRGGAWGTPQSPLFLDQTEARMAKKIFLETGPLPYLRVWMTKNVLETRPPTLSQGSGSGTGLSPNLPTLTV